MLTGCDQGPQHDQPTHGPYVHLVAANVGTNQKLAPDGSVVLAFDRLLLPDTVTRQSFLVVDGFGVALTPTVQYDPVNRVVTLGPLAGAGWLKPDQPYKVILPVPAGDEDTNGVRAVDRATLDPASNREIGFLTTATNAGAPSQPAMNFCTDVLPIFTTHCSASICHGTSTHPAAGLILETPAGIQATAINRPANSANTGPRAVVRPPGRIFGLDAPLIDPGDPGNSWLMYKLLIAPPSPDGTPVSQQQCGGASGSAPQAPFKPPVAFTAISDDERARLSDFVTGNVMPYPSQPGAVQQTDNLVALADLQRLSSWILQGAKVTDCTCP